MALIKMTPSELRDAASFLDGKKQEIGSAVEALKGKVDSTTAEWAGASQNSFVESFNEMLPLLQKDFPEIIDGIMGMLNGAADAIEQADEEVAKAFKG